MRPGKVILSLALCLGLSLNSVLARQVIFDAQNPNLQLNEQLAPYCIASRKQVEAVWQTVDPRTGGQVQLVFVVSRSGKLLNVFPRTLEDNPLTERAVFAVTQCGEFKPLPDGQDALCVIGTFKSKRPKTVVDKSMITDAVVLAALVGLTGLAIYGLLKLSKSTGGGGFGYGYANPDYHWVNPYVTSTGVYVPGHFQTNPNGTILDNYSTQGNINPWTGQPGWIVP